MSPSICSDDLLQDDGGLVSIEVSSGCQLLEAARKIVGAWREFRDHAAAFVSHFSQSRHVVVVQRVSQHGKMLRGACRERLAHFLEQYWVSAAAANNTFASTSELPITPAMAAASRSDNGRSATLWIWPTSGSKCKKTSVPPARK